MQRSEIQDVPGSLAHLFLEDDEFRRFSYIVTPECAIETLLLRAIMDSMDQVEDMQQSAQAAQ